MRGLSRLSLIAADLYGRLSGSAGLQERLEGSKLGRAAISMFVLATLGAIGVTNFPESQVKSRLSRVSQPYVHATGLYQSWAIFTPDPRRIVRFIEGHTEYADGSRGVWRIRPDSGLSAYRDYRWHKFGEVVSVDANDHLWLPLAEYLANRARTGDRVPVRVTLVRRWREIAPPGPGPDWGPWQEFAFFTLSVEQTP